MCVVYGVYVSGRVESHGVQVEGDDDGGDGDRRETRSHTVSIFSLFSLD